MKAAKPNKSAARSMDILEFIAKSDKPVSMAEICRELDIPRPSQGFVSLEYKPLPDSLASLAGDN